MAQKRIEALIKKLPHLPGVYKMKDEEGRILYIGKAKDLSHRVRSYFRKSTKATRTEKLLERVVDLEWTEVGSDLEALLLETNLIKEFRPKYNVLMKDDKNFVYIKITKNEDFPRIEIVRRVEKDGARYFGPKTSAHSVKKTLGLLQKLFMYRSCDLSIEWAEGKAAVTKKTMAYPCLDYHIKRCAAPCIGKISPEDYAKSIEQIERFLEGKTGDIEQSLQEQMGAAVQQKEFERAALLRDKLLSLRRMFESKQIVTSPTHEDMDILGFVIEGGKAFLTLFMLRDGKLIDQENFITDSGEYEAGEEAEAEEVVESFLYQYYEKSTTIPPQILIPLSFEESDFFTDWASNQAGRSVKLLIPERGKKHQLLELAEKNARSFQKQNKARWESMAPSDAEALEELSAVLGLPKPAKRMECYDISHLGGSDTVASMVVFENGTAKKSDYRKFHLQSIADGEIDDFKSMKEILYRRLSHLSLVPAGFQVRKAAKTHIPGMVALLKEWRGLEEVEGDLEEYQVVLKDKKVLGLLRLLPGKEGTALIKALYVTPKAREQKLGRSLVFTAIEKLKLKRLYVSCVHEMGPLYDRLGFEEIKNFPTEFSEHQLDLILAYDPTKHMDASFETKPDLIVIDGGKGQLGMAVKSRDALGLKIPMIGLAKREEDVFVPGKSFPLLIPKDSKASYLLQRIRDEAHRFAITFQKSTRKKHLTASALDAIPGIGKATKMKLLKHFGSVEVLKAASEADLAAVVGDAVIKSLQKLK
ncbi:MAG: excinuclease ABC subunit UvrC [Candidatus Gracilibacteria bacterium]|jgi:excinuclease ABC subunit C